MLERFGWIIVVAAAGLWIFLVKAVFDEVELAPIDYPDLFGAVVLGGIAVGVAFPFLIAAFKRSKTSLNTEKSKPGG
jgi:hypothetical protein